MSSAERAAARDELLDELSGLKAAIEKCMGIQPRDIPFVISSLKTMVCVREHVLTQRREHVDALQVDCDKLLGYAHEALGLEPGTSISETCQSIHAVGFRQDELDFEALHTQMRDLEEDNARLRTQCEHALRSSYHLAALACDVSGMPAMSIRNAADQLARPPEGE